MIKRYIGEVANGPMEGQWISHYSRYFKVYQEYPPLSMTLPTTHRKNGGIGWMIYEFDGIGTPCYEGCLVSPCIQHWRLVSVDLEFWNRNKHLFKESSDV